jgi:hypothetical protein
LIDLLFAANGHSYESLLPYVRTIRLDGVQVRTLDIEGLLKTKMTYRDKDRIDRQVLERLQVDVPLLQQLRGTPLRPVQSQAVSKIGFDPKARMLVVQYTSGTTIYGYPHLSDEEVAGLLAVLESDDSIGHYISTVIKPNHDHERIQL